MKTPDFTLTLPDEWRDHSTLTFAPETEDEFCRNITINRDHLDAVENIQAYAARQLAELEEALADQNYRLIHDAPMEVDGVEAIMRLHIFDIPDLEVQVQQAQVYLIRDSVALTVTFTERIDRFEAHFQEFLEIMRTTRWIDDSPVSDSQEIGTTPEDTAPQADNQEGDATPPDDDGPSA